MTRSWNSLPATSESRTWKAWFRRAFATRSSQPYSAEDLELLDRVAEQVVRRRMTVPAIFFLDSCRPLNYVASQALRFLQPFLTFVFSERDYERLAEILERRDSPSVLISRIEEEQRRHEARRGAPS